MRKFFNGLIRKIKWSFKYRNISKFLLIIGILSLFFCIYSTIEICRNSDFIYTPNSDGFTNFFTFFNAPIKSFGAFLALLTLYITFERADLNRHNINLNNYYKHMDEFIKMMEDVQKEITSDKQYPIKLLEAIMNSLNKLDLKKLYRHWYGKEYDSKHKVLSKNIDLVKKYYSIILNCKTYQELSNARFGELGETLKELGFFPIIDKVYTEKIDHYEYSFVYIIENLLNFSNDTICNKENYSIGIDVEKHLHKLDQNKKL